MPKKTSTKRVFIVEGETLGEDCYQSWVVFVFEEEFQAESFCQYMNDRLLQHGVHTENINMENVEKDITGALETLTINDENCTILQNGTKYSYSEVPYLTL